MRSAGLSSSVIEIMPPAPLMSTFLSDRLSCVVCLGSSGFASVTVNPCTSDKIYCTSFSFTLVPSMLFLASFAACAILGSNNSKPADAIKQVHLISFRYLEYF